MKSKNQQFTILVVDDAPENVEVLGGLLGERYNVKVALNGEKALQLVSTYPVPDLILLDVMMPGMDGYEVCHRLKTSIETAKIPIIFVTAKADAADETRGFQLGAADYITKPISPSIVEARVETHLALYDQRQDLEQQVRNRTRELDESRLQIIQRLGRAAEYKDNETGMHVLRMSQMSRLLALKAGLSDEEAELMLNAAPMHDVGKIGIPDNILLKPGKLDANEWKIMMSHTAIGAEIIGEHESPLLQMAKTVAETHHEKWNGKGYPLGLAGEDIPLVGRIVALADVFDALTSKRPYKEAWSVEKAADLIKSETGEHFDPELVPLFIQLLPEAEKIRQQFSDEPI